MRRRRSLLVLLVVLAMVTAAGALSPSASAAGRKAANEADAGSTSAPNSVTLPTAAQAGTALAAAVTQDQARAALLTILTGGSIAVDDGTGAPASTAGVTIPSWMLDELATAQVKGSAITVAQNAALFDTMVREAGGPAITTADFSRFLAYWQQHPDSDGDAYVLGAVASLAAHTDPSYDLANAPGTAALPLILLVAEMSSLHQALAYEQTNPPALRGANATLDDEATTAESPCENLAKAKDWAGKAKEDWEKLIEAGQNWNVNHLSWETIEENLENLEGLGERGSDLDPDDLAGENATTAAISGILQTALAQGNIQLTTNQDPRPVAKNEKGEPPNTTTVTLTFKANEDMPKDLADCLKVLGEEIPDIDLPEPGKPISKAHVTVTAGAHFDEHLQWDWDNVTANANGNYYTDDNGQVRIPLQTQTQKLPKGVGKTKTREAMIEIEINLQEPGLSPSSWVAAIFDHLDPWTDEYAVSVTQREEPAISITGSFDLNALLVDVKGSLDLHSCNGFDGALNGTVKLSGAYQSIAKQVGVAFGAPTSGSVSVPAAALVPEQTKATPDDPGAPQLNVITPIAGKIGIEFVDENTAELTIDGTPISSLQTGKVFQFPVTEGASECPGS